MGDAEHGNMALHKGSTLVQRKRLVIYRHCPSFSIYLDASRLVNLTGGKSDPGHFVGVGRRNLGEGLGRIQVAASVDRG